MNTIKSIHIGLHLNLVSDILYVRSRRPLAFLSRCLRMYELKEYLFHCYKAKAIHDVHACYHAGRDIPATSQTGIVPTW